MTLYDRKAGGGPVSSGRWQVITFSGPAAMNRLYSLAFVPAVTCCDKPILKSLTGHTWLGFSEAQAGPSGTYPLLLVL